MPLQMLVKDKSISDASNKTLGVTLTKNVAYEIKGPDRDLVQSYITYNTS